jgi:hypothetical protein
MIHRMEMTMTAPDQQTESTKRVFKSARPELAPKTRDEFSARIAQQLDEHAADYERLSRCSLSGVRAVRSQWLADVRLVG